MRLTKSSDIKKIDRKWNVEVKWTGYNETTMEPLTQFKQDDFVTCAIYRETDWIRMVGGFQESG
jgi:hypothetical protein